MLEGISIEAFRGDYEGLERMAHASWRDEYGQAFLPGPVHPLPAGRQPRLLDVQPRYLAGGDPRRLRDPSVNEVLKEEVIMKRIPIILAAAICCVGIFMSGGTGQSRNEVLQKAGLTADARAAILTVGDDVRKLEKSHENYVKAAGELDGLYIKLLRKSQEVSRLAVEAQKTRGQALDKLFKATGEMQEMSQGFNLQYLALQQSMQDENRRFTLVSNIMKTKHDTAKNAINNIR